MFQMRVLFEMVQAKKLALQIKVDIGKPQYEYDSDEDTEGGTWEHKRRALEMKKTKRKYFSNSSAVTSPPLFQCILGGR